MGRASRQRPARLAGKLFQIRTSLGLSQNEMIRRLKLADAIYQSNISGYESGEREPPLPIILRYAEVAGVWIDVLVDDKLDLPPRLPSVPKSEGVRRRTAAKSGRMQ